jgi:hypothetical protein
MAIRLGIAPAALRSIVASGAGDLVAGVLPSPDKPTGDKIAGATPRIGLDCK